MLQLGLLYLQVSYMLVTLSAGQLHVTVRVTFSAG